MFPLLLIFNSSNFKTMKFMASMYLVLVVCLSIIFQVAHCNPLAEANAEADPFFIGVQGGFGRGNYGGYGRYGREVKVVVLVADMDLVLDLEDNTTLRRRPKIENTK